MLMNIPLFSSFCRPICLVHRKFAPTSRRDASEVVFGELHGYQVRRVGGTFGEALSLLLVLLIGAREPIGVLSQVFLPRRNHVELDELVGGLAVPEKAP